MPQIIVANIDSKAAVVSWVGWDGKKVSTRYTGFLAAATEAQVVAIINAAGAISNAAIWKQEYKSVSEASITASIAYDDAISQAERGANIVYQNTVTLDVKTFRVPAPHTDHLTPDGRFLKDRAADADIETLLAAIETALGGSWTFVNAALSTRGVGTTATIEQPLLQEPP
jgi:hypothetical protein